MTKRIWWRSTLHFCQLAGAWQCLGWSTGLLWAKGRSSLRSFFSSNAAQKAFHTFTAEKELPRSSTERLESRDAPELDTAVSTWIGNGVQLASARRCKTYWRKREFQEALQELLKERAVAGCDDWKFTFSPSRGTLEPPLAVKKGTWEKQEREQKRTKMQYSKGSAAPCSLVVLG